MAQAKTCKCGRTLRPGDRHQCPTNNREVRYEDDDSFFLSALIGAGTDSAIAGAIIGGSVLGGIVGDALDGDLFD